MTISAERIVSPESLTYVGYARDPTFIPAFDGSDGWIRMKNPIYRKGEKLFVLHGRSDDEKFSWYLLENFEEGWFVVIDLEPESSAPHAIFVEYDPRRHGGKIWKNDGEEEMDLARFMDLIKAR